MATCANVEPDRLGPLLLGHVYCMEHDRVIPFCLLLAAARPVVSIAPLVPVEPDPAQAELPIELPAITRLPTEFEALKRAVTLCDETKAANEARTAELKRYAIGHPFTPPASVPADELEPNVRETLDRVLEFMAHQQYELAASLIVKLGHSLRDEESDW